MKMISRQHNKRARQKTYRQVLFIVVFVSLVVFLDYTDKNPLAGVSQKVSSPILKSENFVSAKIADYFSLLQSKKALVSENRELREKALEFQGKNTLTEGLKQENKELKHLLGREMSENFILASVVTRPGISPYDTFVIDAGGSNGIHVGDNVMAYGDFVIGFISKVFANSSQVTLFSSPGEKTNIFIGKGGISGVATGRGAGNFAAELARDLEIEVGEIITLSNFDSQVFGEVETILKGEADAFQTILFKNPVNIFLLKRVQVIKSTR